MSQPPPDQDQQLLKDASTLLMFANAAAGNPGSPQKPSPPQVQPPHPPQPSQPLAASSAPPVLPQTTMTSPHQPSPQMSSQPPSRPPPVSMPGSKYGYPGYYNWQGAPSPPQAHGAPVAFAPPPPAVATAVSPMTAPATTTTTNPRQPIHSSPQQSRPQEIVSTRQHSDPQAAKPPPTRKMNIFSLLDGSEKPPAKTKAVSDPGLKPVTAAPVTTATPAATTTTTTTVPSLPHPTPATPAVAPRAPSVPHKSSINMFLNDDTPSVAIKQKSVSPQQSHEPIPAPNRHSRSKSSPANPGPPPLSATQAMSGIDLKSKERSNKNAMIAARALAAAAEVPLTPQARSVEWDEANRHRVKVEGESPVATPDIPRSVQIVPDRKSEVAAVNAPPATNGSPVTVGSQITVESSVSVGSSVPAAPSAPLPQPPRRSPSPKSQAKPRSKAVTPKQSPKSSQPQQFPGKSETTPQPSSTSISAGRVDDTAIPPLESYRVDPDSGLIGCICGLEDDDGFTIQCDQCFRWQHCLCMGYKTQEEVPEDEYKCYYCDPAKHGKFDAASCREATLRRLNVESTKQPSPKKRKPSSGDSSANKKRKSVQSEPVKAAPRPPSPISILDQLPLKDNPLLTDGVTTETYQSVYFKVKENDYKTPELRNRIKSLSTTKPVEQLGEDTKFKHLKFAKVVLPNHQKYMAEHHRNLLVKNKRHNQFCIQVKPYSDNTKQKFNGISKMGLFIGSNDSDITMVPKGTLVVEYLGEIDLFENYVSEKINQYPHWGVPKPHVLKSKLGESEIVVDARFIGNESRFIRKSCPHAANCRVRPVYDSEAGLRFLVETTKDIEIKPEQMTELRLPWEWDPTHPILSLYGPNPAELKFDSAVPSADKPALMSYIDNILYFCECGCLTGPDASSTCAVLKVKKAMAQVMRSTRKASSISNVNLAKTKEEVIFPQPHKQYVSWAERLVQRDNIIRLQVEVKSEDTMGEGILVEKPPDKPKELFDMPYRDHLIERNQPSMPPAKFNPALADMAFPIVPELAQRIDHIIDEKLKPTAPAAKEAGDDNSTTKPESVTVASPKSVAAVVKEEATKEEVKSDPVPKPPKPVKKLSFADYKKKMK